MIRWSLSLLPVLCLLWSCQDPNEISKIDWNKSTSADLPAVLQINLDDSRSYALKCGSDGAVFPLQQVALDQWLFIPTRDLSENESIVVITTESPPPSVQISEHGGFIAVEMGGREILKYAVAPQLPSDTLPTYYTRSGFIHPLKTKSGLTVTSGFPRGHTHQHGLFNAWTRTTYRGKMIDFWNQQAQLGTVIHQDVASIQNGPVFSSFRTRLSYLVYEENDTVRVLDETWDVRILPLASGYFLDWTTTQDLVGLDTLHIQEYHYGGAAFRGSEYWNVDGGAYDSLVYFLTSKHHTQADGNHSRPTWATMYGRIPDRFAGVAMMGHPSNFRHPQPIRIHPTMPYFCFAPMVLGAFDLLPDKAYSNRYGIFVFDGRPDAVHISRIQQAFAQL